MSVFLHAGAFSTQKGHLRLNYVSLYIKRGLYWRETLSAGEDDSIQQTVMAPGAQTALTDTVDGFQPKSRSKTTKKDTKTPKILDWDLHSYINHTDGL